MKTILVTCSFLMSIILLTAFMNTDPPLFKNLKILRKDISKEELDSVMHHFTASLGQKCTFCHVRNEQDKKMDFPNDSIKYKLIARKMMLMAIKINKDNFPPEDKNQKGMMMQAVTCYTCHRGDAIPKTKPPIPVRDSLRNQTQFRDSLKSLQEPVRLRKDSVPN